MRVTKNLQEVIKGGYSNVNAAVNAGLEAKAEALKKQVRTISQVLTTSRSERLTDGNLTAQHAQNLAARKASRQRLGRQAHEKRSANEKLERAIMDASVAVAQREQIATMQLAAADKEGLARRRMKEVVTRRRLLVRATKRALG